MKNNFIILSLAFLYLACNQVDSNKLNAEIHYKLAVSLEESENFLSATKAHSKAIKLSPEITRAYLDRSIDYNILDSTERAISDLDIFLSKVPNAAEAHVWRAEYKRKVGLFKSALADANKGLELAGGFIKNVPPIPFYEGAFDSLPEQYQIEPGYAAYEIAFANYELENYEEAINFAKWTLPEIPADGYMEIIIGCSLLQLDSIESGCNVLRNIEIFDEREAMLYRTKCSIIPE